VDHGCAAKTQVERVLSFDIPEVDYDYPESGDLNHSKFDSEMHK